VRRVILVVLLATGVVGLTACNPADSVTPAGDVQTTAPAKDAVAKNRAYEGSRHKSAEHPSAQASDCRYRSGRSGEADRQRSCT
jgi:hypothetical protein